MKILTCCYEYPPLGGGGAKVVQGLTDELASSGHAVDIVTMQFGRLPLYAHRGKVILYRVPSIRRSQYVCTSLEMIPYIFRAFFVALRLAREKHYDINHTHFIFPDGVVAWLVNKVTGLPYIITVHGSDVPGYNPNRFRIFHKILRPLWKAVVADARCLVCPSRTLEKLVKDASPLARTQVIPNGFDHGRLTPHSPKTKSILCVTRMLERKGVQYLMRALQGMELGDTQVHIVGDGPYLARVKEIARECGVQADFHGFMDNDSPELKKLFEEADIFVFTSETENFPIVLLEAMAAGAAIITTRGTGCDEVVGETAVLVEPRNTQALREALLQLLGTTELRSRLGRLARTRVEEQFSWSIVATFYINTYEKIFSSNS